MFNFFRIAKGERIFIKTVYAPGAAEPANKAAGSKTVKVDDLVVLSGAYFPGNAQQVEHFFFFFVPYQHFMQKRMSAEKAFISFPDKDIELRIRKMVPEFFQYAGSQD